MSSSVDTRQLIQIGARQEVVRLSAALRDLLTTFPNFRALPEVQFLSARSGPPAKTTRLNGKSIETPNTKAKRRISKATRDALRANAIARWAAVKAAGGSRLGHQPKRTQKG